MHFIGTIFDNELSASILQKGFYAFAAFGIIGTAAYLGYRAAESESKHILCIRYPELNEKVKESI